MRPIYSTIQTGKQRVSLFARNVLLAAALSPLFYACHSAASAPDASSDSAAHPSLPVFKRNPEFRDNVKKEAVADYKVKTDDKLNEQFFSVRLYETHETMKYVAKVEFEGLKGDDTIKLPDLGTAPKPVLQKGPEKYSCIIGLIDNQKEFRPLKKVYVTGEGGELKITTLKHYMVTEDYRLVGQ